MKVFCHLTFNLSCYLTVLPNIFMWQILDAVLLTMIHKVCFCLLENHTVISLCVCVCAQSYLTLFDPMNCHLPSSSIHELFQARVLEWFAISYSRGSSWGRIFQGSNWRLLHWQVDSSPLRHLESPFVPPLWYLFVVPVNCRNPQF